MQTSRWAHCQRQVAFFICTLTCTSLRHACASTFSSKIAINVCPFTVLVCVFPSCCYLLHCGFIFMNPFYRWCPDEASGKEMVRVMFPLLFDATTEYIADNVSFPSLPGTPLLLVNTFWSRLYFSRSYCHGPPSVLI